ncbi:MAG TPA: Minf_1886 family protein [Pirellulales bacterium]|nr:Minf_1886 family protein [Pirellulales bacterium]
MPDPAQELSDLLRQDRRYKIEAYAFVFDALGYAHKVLGMGLVQESEDKPEPGGGKRSGAEPREAQPSEMESSETESADEPAAGERHLTGQQLCEAIRIFALEQYGYMAKCVLNSWGVHKTGDFGEIVFNLIRIGQMRKTKDDRREDFNDVFDFESGLTQSFQIKHP